MNAISNTEINIDPNAGAVLNENRGTRGVGIDQLILHCQQMGLCSAGLEYIKRVASSPPSRRVRSGFASNVVCRFPSTKMGVTIQAESHRCELALIYVLEHAADVLAYWDQPEDIKISYVSRKGRLTSQVITPDFLVVRRTGVEFIEAKLAEALPELAKDMPNRFVQGDDGIWRSPPAETAAHFYGFGFRIWTPSEVDPIWLQNIKFLQDYFNADVQLVPQEIRKHIVEVVGSDLGLALGDLRQRCQTATLDHIYNLLAHDELYVDLAAAPLTDSTRAKLFTCRKAADTHAFLNKNSTLNGSQNGFVSSETAPMKLGETAIKLLRTASPEDHSMANHRLQILFDAEYRNSHPEPGRTIRRWRRSFRAAEELYGNGLLGLFPRFKDRGNHKPRFGEELLALVDRIIDDVYCTPRVRTSDTLTLNCVLNVSARVL